MISIIGAGPIGSYLAYLLAKNGEEVRIFEEHKVIGKPVQCTGIVTEDINKLIKLDKKFISNIINRAIIHSKNKNIEINTKEIILNREKFDKYILDLATKAGAKLYKGHRYEKFDGKTLYFSNGKKFDTDILIGADGPNSRVAETNELGNKKQFYVGIQIRARINSKSDIYQVFLGEDFPKFFGWIVPENNKILRIGIAAKQNPELILNNFIKRLKINKKSIIEKQGGIIPVYNPKKRIQKRNVFLIGDSAAMVKATTGGGIITGMRAAKILCNCILNKKNYQKEFKKKIGISLWPDKKIRQMLDKFNDKDFDKLLEYTGQKRIQKILLKNARDSPWKILVKIAILEPRFFRFITKL